MQLVGFMLVMVCLFLIGRPNPPTDAWLFLAFGAVLMLKDFIWSKK